MRDISKFYSAYGLPGLFDITDVILGIQYIGFAIIMVITILTIKDFVVFQKHLSKKNKK